MSAPKVKAPEQSQEEKDLMKKQTDILGQQQSLIEAQYKQQNLLAPLLFKQLGIKPTIDPTTGEITGYEQIDDPNAAMSKDIESQFLKRSLSALKGELPIDPTLTSELGLQEKNLHESLRKQLGSGYETSTPGQEALANFQKKKAELLSSASRGDLTLGESLGLARENSNQQQISDFLGRVSGVNQQPLASAAAFGQNAAGYSNPLQNLQNNRAMQFQASRLNAENATTQFGQIFGGIGSLFGTAAGVYAGSRR